MFNTIISWFKKLVLIAETAEFSTIFGSAAQKKWFMTMMQSAGKYLFSASLLISILKLGFHLRDYYYAKNKNLKENSSLVWVFLQTGLLATAIAGTLIAATTFLLITPVLFACAMALDTLRNLALLGWNIFQLSRLYFACKSNLDNPLVKPKYDHFKSIFIANIKEYLIGTIVGAAVTAAVAVIMVFPHVGLGAAAAAGITVAGVKLSTMALTGVAAATSLVAPLAIPVLIESGRKITTACKYVFSNTWSLLTYPFFSKSKKQDKGKSPLITQEKTIEKDDKTLIRTSAGLEIAKKPLEFNAFSYNTNFRDAIIKHIDKSQPELALDFIKESITNKIKVLDGQAKDTLSWSGWWQQNKRQQKLNALKDIQSYLETSSTCAVRNMQFYDIKTFISKIESKYPDIDKSFFLQESDTRNILNALKAYAERFQQSVPSASDPNTNRSVL